MNMNRPLSISTRKVKSASPRIAFETEEVGVIEQITAVKALSQEDNKPEEPNNATPDETVKTNSPPCETVESV
jgi:hypothetical protein